MSFLDRLFGTEEADESANDVAAIELAQGQALSRISENELAALKDSAVRTVRLPVGSKAAIAADALIPFGANVAQGVNEIGMAMVLSLIHI